MAKKKSKSRNASTKSKPQQRRPSLLSAQAQEALDAKIMSRPKADELRSHNISTSSDRVDPGLAGVAKKLERNLISNDLNSKLYTRGELADLQKQGIIRSDDAKVAPRLQAAKHKLEHNITRDEIGRLLDARQTQEDLAANNILTQNDRRMAPSIAGPAAALEHTMKKDKLTHLLEKRTSIIDLEKKHILNVSDGVAPAIQGPQKQLEKQLHKSNLYHALKHRPSVVELQNSGILPSRAQQQQFADAYDERDDDDDDEEEFEPAGYQRRSKNFHLTRILLKFVASMAEAGEISLQQKGLLKDLIVDQDNVILAVAETFDAENDVHDFKDSLVRLARV